MPLAVELGKGFDSDESWLRASRRVETLEMPVAASHKTLDPWRCVACMLCGCSGSTAHATAYRLSGASLSPRLGTLPAAGPSLVAEPVQ
jgi:hypothetical protein